METGRIRVLPPALADQIAAGEVVERPASVLKELVENALDAGARRVEVDLVQGGLGGLAVLDDGHGIHPEDLPLAVTRHATSKVAGPEDLVEIGTLGFRGEALASLASVATVRLRSRRADMEVGCELTVMPGGDPSVHPVGMAVGTRVQVEGLFATVPARRKFLRAAATEAAACVEATLRLGLVEPAVALVLRNDGRTLVELPAEPAGARVARVLARRGYPPPVEISGEEEGIAVRAFIVPPAGTRRGRGQVHVVLRRRVVAERSLSRILASVLADHLPPGHGPAGVLEVEPPPGTVDVNVHPQKAEVRLKEPQRVYGAVRAVLARAVSQAFGPAGAGPEPDAEPSRSFTWSEPPAPAPAPARDGGGAGYRLSTRALGREYGEHKEQVREVTRALGPRLPGGATAPGPAAQGSGAPAGREPEPAAASGPVFLGCLPGPVALYELDGELLAADLLRLRAHLVRRRLERDLAGGEIAAQGLLSPAVVRRPGPEVALVAAHGQALARLGLVVEPFAEDALVVRAVPAALSGWVEAADLGALLDRVLPWLRLHAQGKSPLEAGAEPLSHGGGRDPAPRLARRFMRELVALGEPLDRAPGLRRWRPGDLIPARGGAGS